MFVYVLRSQTDGSHYVGMTEDIDTRVKQHNQGKNYSTKKKLPWFLVHTEYVKTRKEARKLEKFLKSGYGREIVQEIISTLS